MADHACFQHIIDGERLLLPRHRIELRPLARRDRDLTSGPARLCQALGIDGAFDGADVVRGDRGVRLLDDGAPADVEPATSTRIGLSAGADLPWRWYLPGDPYVSARPR